MDGSSDRRVNLLCLGRKGASAPFLLLYGAELSGDTLTALGYTVRYAVTQRSETLVEMERTATAWRCKRGGLRVSLKKQPARHHMHESITLNIRRKHK